MSVNVSYINVHVSKRIFFVFSLFSGWHYIRSLTSHLNNYIAMVGSRACDCCDQNPATTIQSPSILKLKSELIQGLNQSLSINYFTFGDRLHSTKIT